MSDFVHFFTMCKKIQQLRMLINNVNWSKFIYVKKIKFLHLR